VTHGKHSTYKMGCRCEACCSVEREWASKAARMARTASRMRQRYSRVVKIRATVLARRGHSKYYPKQVQGER
jgi:hypothetical protein